MIIISLTLMLLILGQSIILPFVIALLIWFIVKKIRNLIDKIGFIKRFIPTWIKSILASLFIFSVLLFAARVLMSSIESLSLSYPDYLANAESIALTLNAYFDIDVHEDITHFVETFDFTSHLQSLLNSISEIVGNMVMIIFYTIFLFIEETLFQHKFRLIFSGQDQHESYSQVMKKVDRSLSGYIGLKSLISLITTTLSYIVLVAVGIDSPLFWAFLIFMLNFIPSVGPIIGTVLPSLFSLIQFGEFVPFFIILFSVGTIAMLVGSFVEPRLMGNTLNISPLVAIISLAVWGAIWGITGMLLSVPITVALIILLAQFPGTRAAAILLSEKGRV